MSTTTIIAVTPIPDIVDRFEWTVRLGTGFWGLAPRRAYVLFWDGRIAFYLEPVPVGSMPAALPVRMLPTRWTNRDSTARLFLPRETNFKFETDLPGNALQRLEEFRNGARLYARLEGKLVAAAQPEGIEREAAEHSGVDSLGLLRDLSDVMGEPGRRVHGTDIRSEPFELTRDFWCETVLGTLRPPGRVVLEFVAGPPSQEQATAAAAHWREAQKALDHGRHEEVARLCARALEELNKLLDAIEVRYGRFGRDRLAEQIKSTKSLCDPVRHAERPHHDGLQVDLPLARHLLAVTASLIAVACR